MNCRHFESDLPDWVSGRLPEHHATRMLAHSVSCESCSRVADGERTLLVAWREIPALPDTPNLWPRIAARLQDMQTAKPAPASWLSWLVAPSPSIRYGMAGTAAAAVLLAIVMSRPTVDLPQGINPVTNNGVDESHVIQLVSERQSLPDAEGDLAIGQTPRYRAAERVVLGYAAR